MSVPAARRSRANKERVGTMRRKNYQPTNKDNFNYLKNRQKVAGPTEARPPVKVVVVNVPTPIKELHEPAIKDSAVQEEHGPCISTCSVEAEAPPAPTAPVSLPVPPSASQALLLEEERRWNAHNEAKTPSPIQGTVGKPLTYDEILESLSHYNTTDDVQAEGSSIRPKEQRRHLQPPLPESFERPGDFFKYVLCEVSTPGKAPAIRKPLPKQKSTRPPLTAGAPNSKLHRQETEDRKALILKRAEELYRKKKRMVKNRLVDEMAECTKPATKRLKKPKRAIKKRGGKTRKRGKSKTKPRRKLKSRKKIPKNHC